MDSVPHCMRNPSWKSSTPPPPEQRRVSAATIFKITRSYTQTTGFRRTSMNMFKPVTLPCGSAPQLVTGVSLEWERSCSIIQLLVMAHSLPRARTNACTYQEFAAEYRTQGGQTTA